MDTTIDPCAMPYMYHDIQPFPFGSGAGINNELGYSPNLEEHHFRSIHGSSEVRNIIVQHIPQSKIT